MARGQSFRLLSLFNKKGVFWNFWLCPLAILLSLVENPYAVPHFKALISG